jgi:hypothetical protein
VLQVRPIITKIRRRLNDMQGDNYSDYELVDVLADAQRMLYIALADNGSEIPKRRKELTLTDGRAPLPADYYSMICANGCHVDGRDLASPKELEGAVILEYNCVPLPPLKRMEDVIDIPYTVLLDTVEIAVLIAQGNTAGAMETAIQSAKRIGGRREHGRIPDRRWCQ